jgi:hypothetical protein
VTLAQDESVGTVTNRSRRAPRDAPFVVKVNKPYC